MNLSALFILKNKIKYNKLTMSILSKIASRIIKEQETIIGPLAWEQVKNIPGLKIVDKKEGDVELAGDEKEIIDLLVARYDRLFGRASHEVSREAVATLLADLSPEEIPTSLQV